MRKALILQRNKDDQYTTSSLGSSKPTRFIKTRHLSQNPGIRYIATGKSQIFSGSDLATCRTNLNSGITLRVSSRAPSSDDKMSGTQQMFTMTTYFAASDSTSRHYAKISDGRYLAIHNAQAFCHSEHTITVDSKKELTAGS